MELSQVSVYVERCIHDAPAPCSCACPFGLDIRSFLKKVARGRLPAAYRELRTATAFPTLAAAFCPRPCREKCRRTLLGDEALDLGGLEQAVLRLAGHQEPDVFQVPEKQAAVAVVGAGPAGLALALNMAQKKYPVTVFERREGWGGKLREHPDFPVFNADFANQFSCEKVEFRFGTEVTDLGQLEGFAAVYLATGEGGEAFGLRESWDPVLFTADRVCTFLGGGLCGMSLMESLAAGAEISRLMEGAIQTGRATGGREKPRCHDHRLIPDDAVSAPRVPPADPGEGYTKAEAKQEAARCFQCTCDRCLKGCELLEKYGKAPQQIAMEVLADSSPHFLASRTMTRETYSCNQCGWCKADCPESVDLGGLFHLSRTARAEDGIQPAALHDFWLRDLEFASHDAFLAAPPKGKDTCAYAFFPGCQLPGCLPDQTLAAYEALAGELDLGAVLGCCGASAWWAGEKELWEENAVRLKEAWESLGRPAFVLACATCGDMLRRMVPEIKTVSLYTLLAQQEGLPASAPFPQAAVFDPCSARGDEQARASVRLLAGRSGTALEELADPGRCCGWGGHMRTANPQLYNTITDHRAAQSQLPYVVYCANCREVFLEKGKPCRHILEVLFGPCGQSWHLAQKRENRLRVKGRLMQIMGVPNEQASLPAWNSLALQISEAVRREMELQLISDEDVRECIWNSIQGEERFVDQDGIYLASMQKRVLTYWVEYRETDGAYEVRSAYCHRMRFGEEGQA